MGTYKKCIGTTFIDKKDNCFRILSVSIINSNNDNFVIIKNDINKARKYYCISDCLYDIKRAISRRGYFFPIDSKGLIANDIYFLDNITDNKRYSKAAYQYQSTSDYICKDRYTQEWFKKTMISKNYFEC